MKSAADHTQKDEKSAFSARLKKAIGEFDENLLSPTALAKEFNKRSRSSKIGTTAAHKWLSGDAIPRQDNLAFIAAWLRVSVQWLRFGEAEDEPALSAREQRRQDKVLSDFVALGERDKVLIEKLMREMLQQKPE